jgi:hypothetical protein
VSARTVPERFPAGAPRGSWPAEECAATRCAEQGEGATDQAAEIEDGKSPSTWAWVRKATAHWTGHPTR